MPNYQCINCKKIFNQKSHLKDHLNRKFKCGNTNITLKKQDKNYIALQIEQQKEETVKNEVFILCKCGKKYKTKSGLWKHEQKCGETSQIYHYKDKFDQNYIAQILLEQSKQHNKQLLEQNQEFKNMIIEVTKNIQPNQLTNNTMMNSNNNSNNKFNLNFFLNETCKNAMNLTDFVDSFKLDFNDFESMGTLGYVEGLSNIIIKKLNSIPVHERPVHCNDFKRETMYLKIGDVWEKEEESKPRLKKVIKQIGNKNFMLMNSWIERNPDCRDGTTRKSTQFVKIMQGVTGGVTKEENEVNDEKIITKIAKNVLIEKV